MLEVPFIVSDNYCLKFLGVCDFTTEFAWIICTDEMEIFTFRSDFGPDSVVWRNIAVVIEVKGVWVGRLESGLWGICSIFFEPPSRDSDRFPWHNWSSAIHAQELQVGQGCGKSP